MSTNPYKLTRFLYPVDEVQYSLITSLVKKENIDACYYWAFELYYSGLENHLFDLFFKIHYDFYAERNPKLEHYIVNKRKKWMEDKDIRHVAFIVKNLFIATPTPTVFLMRQYINSSGHPSHVYNAASGSSVSHINFTAEYKNLCMAISYGRLANIAHDINRLVKRDGSDVVREVIIDHFRIEFGGFIDRGREKLDKAWNERIIFDDIHLLLAMIVHLMVDDDKINTRSVFGTPLQENIDEILEIENTVIEKKYRTLCFKRKWKTCDLIGSFELSRHHSLSKFIEDNWFHWEYYASGVPLWYKRIQDYNGIINHDKRELVFHDEEMEEQFREQYGYELDEQPKEVQDLSLHNIMSSSWKLWFYNIFGPNRELSVIDALSDDFSKIHINNSSPDLDILSIVKNIPTEYKIIY